MNFGRCWLNPIKFDLIGTYDIKPRTDDEEIAVRQILESADVDLSDVFHHHLKNVRYFMKKNVEAKDVAVYAKKISNAGKALSEFRFLYEKDIEDKVNKIYSKLIDKN